MLFHSGSLMITTAGRSLGLRSRFCDGWRYVAPELLEVLLEHLGQLLRLRVVRRRVAPRFARTHHLSGNTRHLRRDREAESVVRLRRYLIELTADGRTHHG